MLLSHVQRPPWPLTCLLLASVSTATIAPSNSTTAVGNFQGTVPLRHTDGDQAQIADLVPLTREAAQRTIEGNLFNTNFSNVANISDSEIAFISCNPADYSGYADPQRVFEDAYRSANISGVILYSAAADYCAYQQNGNQDMMQDFPVFSMSSRQASASLLDQVDDLPAHLKFFVRVQGRGNDNNNNSGAASQQNPLGPSPSTAVAMIILYSITGIITALFLVIIITGAIRAHRHPERYGPRDVLGRPRQSRARGLARAMLDTIPIVKFGEKEPVKPTDVELASNAEGSDSNGTAEQRTEQAATDTNHAPKPADKAEISCNNTTVQLAEQQEGIAPAQPAIAAATGDASSSTDENLGCSICTEDFEKGQDLRVLPCDHKFHPECVDPWLLNVSGTCPLCRVDLRPVTSHDSSASHDSNELAPPLNPEPERHRSAFRDILSLRYRPNATPQERIYYLRRLREQRRNRIGEVAEDAAEGAGSSEDVADRRRSKRMSVRLSGVFSGRARRERSPTQQGESSRTGAQPQPFQESSHIPEPGTRAPEKSV
ncbi:hypothetical protein EK21DRAFT_60911 [Setomelanomma holmii]|uniref:RING-type domain-containing protein n=1 Tax=Setomelanomma holmii TaxID=210430 RepID=A0A9P4HE11_9PLEO|nr:hypothetical protein EK21DRAFT_60911 [Setomelanomma holmii]